MKKQAAYGMTRVCHLKRKKRSPDGSVSAYRYWIWRINKGFQSFEKIYLHLWTYMKIFVPVLMAFSSALR